jgi:type II secretory pathway pseudopilin PulG
MKVGKIKNKLNRGFTTIDIIISIAIIMIFTSIITALFYNFYITTTARSRNAMATNYIISVIEKVKTMDYDEVNTSRVNTLISDWTNNKTISSGYTITSEVTPYNSTAGNEDKENIIKILKVTVKYKIGANQEKIEISTLITK